MSVTPALAWSKLLLLPLFALIVLGALVALVLLLANPKTRTATLALVGVLGAVAVLLLLVFLGFTVHTAGPVSRRVAVRARAPVANGNSSELLDQYPTLVEDAEIQQPIKPKGRSNTSGVPSAPPPQAEKAPTSPDTAAKREDELSQAAATKTVWFLRAIARVLGRALAEEEQILAAKKGTAKSLPVPVEKEAGKPANLSAPANALTLTLSQGERGPDKATPRPAWVNAQPKLVDDAYQMSIAIGPYTTRAECDARLPEELQKALGYYVSVCLGDEAADDVQLPTEYLRQQLVKAQWEETRQHSVGPMTWLHVLLHFDHKIKDRVLEEHRQAIVAQRLHMVAGWSAIGLALLTVAFGYLKIDLATGGVYRGRLRLAAATAILGLVAAAVVAV